MHAPERPLTKGSQTASIAAAISAITVVGVGISLSIPLLALELESRGVSAKLIGINTAVAGVATIAVAPFVPALVKKLGVRLLLTLAIVATAIVGAVVGFLWWNTAPARIFMGDTGSLAMGGALAALAILSRTELLLPILGGLFVIVTLSVIGQVGSYKLTGRRMFRMAPLHHHFEMKGWPEVQIVVRFWIIQGICIAAALGGFYAEWVRQ